MTIILGVLAVWTVWYLPVPRWVSIALAVGWLGAYLVAWRRNVA